MTFKRQTSVTELIQFIQTYGDTNAYLQQSDPTTTIATDAIKYAITQLVEKAQFSNYMRVYNTTLEEIMYQNIGFTTDPLRTQLNIVIEAYIPVLIKVVKKVQHSIKEALTEIVIQDHRTRQLLDYNITYQDVKIELPYHISKNPDEPIAIYYLDATISGIINEQSGNIHGKELWLDELEIQYIKLVGGEYFLSVYNKPIPTNHAKILGRITSSLSNRSWTVDSRRQDKGI